MTAARIGRRGATFMLVALLVAACSDVTNGSGSTDRPGGTSDAAHTTAAPQELVVYAAASLKNALAAVAAKYEATHPGTTVTISSDSSAALATKIEQGAPADLFLSADTANARKLADEGLTKGGVVPFARNALTIVIPVGDPGGVGSAADLARAGVRIVAAGDAVPISRYATQVVANLAALPGYPSDFAARYAANVVSKEDNVAAVLAKIELGEGDAAIVYATDAKGSAKVATVPVPDQANVTATYGGVVVKGSRHEGAAESFLAWLAGADGQAVLATFGFRAAG